MKKGSKKALSKKKPRNKFEKKIWDQLTKNKIKFEYENLKLDYTLEGVYCPDFELENGVIIETKGEFDSAARRKMSAVKEAHPDLDIRFVFYNANQKLSKKSKMTYGGWASKYGFPYSNQTIPDEWLKE